MYPAMIPGSPHDNDGFSSFRNPDDFFPKRRGTPPDRLGVLFIRILETVSDQWEAVGRRRTRTAEGHPSQPQTSPDTTPLCP
jgi:hypothetical protein